MPHDGTKCGGPYYCSRCMTREMIDAQQERQQGEQEQEQEEILARAFRGQQDGE